MIAPLPTPAQRTATPSTIARVCVNGHLFDATVPAAPPPFIDVNRADPLAVRTDAIRCATCGAGTILGCPGCGYPIPGVSPHLAYAVPHFCIVCGEFYPWTFRGQFFATLAEILEESPRLSEASREHALELLGRLREGLATGREAAQLTSVFEGLGGSDADLAHEILLVVRADRAARSESAAAEQARPQLH